MGTMDCAIIRGIIATPGADPGGKKGRVTESEKWHIHK